MTILKRGGRVDGSWVPNPGGRLEIGAPGGKYPGFFESGLPNVAAVLSQIYCETEEQLGERSPQQAAAVRRFHTAVKDRALQIANADRARPATEDLIAEAIWEVANGDRLEAQLMAGDEDIFATFYRSFGAN